MPGKKSIDNETQFFEFPLTSNQEISPGVYVISFRRTFDFKPGQVVKISVDDEHPPRIYSI